MLVAHRSLMSAQQPTLEQRDGFGDPRQKLRRPLGLPFQAANAMHVTVSLVLSFGDYDSRPAESAGERIGGALS